ncbi:hypothetical protein [Rhodopila sp.]|uniref:hypothetical protein n=1 Tax=Rhodopila sp. TaxID=2480087 RepID=UPI003D0E0130
MNSVSNFVHSLLDLLVSLGNIVVAALVTVEVWLRAQLTQLGLPPPIQTAILVAVAVLLIIGALRLFGGLIRVAVVLVLILIAIHIALPVLQH